MIGREDGKEGGSDKFVKPRLHALDDNNDNNNNTPAETTSEREVSNDMLGDLDRLNSTSKGAGKKRTNAFKATILGNIDRDMHATGIIGGTE